MDNSIIDTRSARLAAAIGARGLTRAGLAAAMKVPASAVTAWASPRDYERPTKGPKRGGKPSAVTTAQLAQALALDPAALEPGGPWGPLVGLEVEEQHRVRLELEAWEALPEAERLKRGLELLALLGVDEEEVGT